MSSPFIAEIVMFGGNFAPRNWALCDGQLLQIASNQALFSLLGTTYGGDGRITFGLPEMRGRVSIHPGNGPGLSNRRLGEKGGSESIVLQTENLPAHHHVLKNNAFEGEADQTDPAGHAFAETAENAYTDQTPGAKTVPNETENTGSNQSFSIMQPFQAVNYIIALQGVFPSRN